MSSTTGQAEGKATLVMSGGGAFGAFEVGCLEYIRDHHPERNYESYAGTSVGALNAAMLAQFEEFSEGVEALLKLWKGIKGHRDIWRWTIWGYLKALCSTGIYNTAPLRRLIEENLDIERLNQSGKSLVLGAANLLDGSYREIRKPANEPLPPADKEHLVDWIMATTSFPGAFPAVEIEQQLYTDGGIIQIAPLISTVIEDYQVIDVVLSGPKDNISPVSLAEVRNVFNMLPRLLVTLYLAIWLKDLHGAYLLNQLREEQGKEPAKITVYAPKKPFSFDPLSFDPDELQTMLQMGREVEPLPLKEFLFATSP